MATATLDMENQAVDKKVLKIMYRKGSATMNDVETSFRRSVDSAGLSVSKLLKGSLGRLVKNGNLGKRTLKSGEKFTFKHGRTA